jgi:outer membrane receptor protein involved in Fe transport
VGTFLKNAFKNFAQHLDGEDANSILQFRVRHILRGDVELGYKKFSTGFSVSYNSFFEKITPAFVTVLNFIDGGKNTLDIYKQRHLKGDWVFNLRFGYQMNDKTKVTFLVKNVGNKEYSVRPGNLDPPITYILQFRITI